MKKIDEKLAEMQPGAGSLSPVSARLVRGMPAGRTCLPVNIHVDRVMYTGIVLMSLSD
jgi:hypothetical protein